jgi:hypothetical protein
MAFSMEHLLGQRIEQHFMPMNDVAYGVPLGQRINQNFAAMDGLAQGVPWVRVHL